MISSQVPRERERVSESVRPKRTADPTPYTTVKMQVSSTTAHEEESLPRIPDLRVAQTKFLLQSVDRKNDSLKKALLRDIEDKEMAPFYAETCRDLGWKVDEALLARLKAKNEAKLKELQDKLETVEKNEGESEIREALQAKTEYLAQIGDKDAAIEAAKKTMEKTVSRRATLFCE